MKIFKPRGIRSRVAIGTISILIAGLAITNTLAYLAVEKLLLSRQQSEVELVLSRSLLLPRYSSLKLDKESLVKSVPADVYLEVFDDQGVTMFSHEVAIEPGGETFVVPSREDFSNQFIQITSITGNETLLVKKRVLTLQEQVPVNLNGQKRTIASGVAGILITDDLGLLQTLLRIQILVSLVLIALAIVSLYWITKVALRPLREVARTAEELAVGDYSKRIPIVNKNSEIGAMSIVLNETFEKIEATNSRMQTFVADASHELRTPLASIHGWVDLYANEGIRTWSDVDEAMLRIQSESTRMNRLVDQLLLLARMDVDNSVTDPECEAINICKEILTNVQMIATKHIFSFDQAELTELTIAVNGDDLTRVVSNLLVNATMHTPPGSRIGLSIREVMSPSHAVEIVVSDDGPGMSESDLRSAMDRFWRADKSRNRDSGAGLGLAIVREITKFYGGSIELNSNSPRGLVAQVRLPINGK